MKAGLHRGVACWQAGGAVISVQVLNEVTSACLRKLKMPWHEVDALLLAVKAACEVLPLTVASHEKAPSSPQANRKRWNLKSPPQRKTAPAATWPLHQAKTARIGTAYGTPAQFSTFSPG